MTDKAMGQFLHNMLGGGEPVQGPPYTHTIRREPPIEERRPQVMHPLVAFAAFSMLYFGAFVTVDADRRNFANVPWVVGGWLLGSGIGILIAHTILSAIRRR